MSNLSNISTATQINTLQKDLDRYKENRRQIIVQKYDDKKKNFKRQTITNTVFFSLFTASGLYGAAAKAEGNMTGRNGFDKALIIAGILGMLTSLLYKKDKSKMENNMQKELNEVV